LIATARGGLVRRTAAATEPQRETELYGGLAEDSVDVDLAVFDGFERADQTRSVQGRERCERLAEHPFGQAFQAADAKTLDLLGEFLKTLDRLAAAW